MWLAGRQTRHCPNRYINAAGRTGSRISRVGRTRMAIIAARPGHDRIKPPDRTRLGLDFYRVHGTRSAEVPDCTLASVSTGNGLARHPGRFLGCIKLALVVLHSVPDAQSPSAEALLGPIVWDTRRCRADYPRASCPSHSKAGPRDGGWWESDCILDFRRLRWRDPIDSSES